MLRLIVIGLILPASLAAAILKDAGFGLRAPEGFSVSKIVATDSAGEIDFMTLDASGQIVVAGGGTIRTLIDQNRDGKPDQTQRLASIAYAVSAMRFDGSDLLVLADDGTLWRLDSAGLASKWGSAPARGLRRGPDGWWYALGETFTRISSDGKQREALADGFRGPRDFDFNSAGDAFTFDADLAADFFLPWYVPSRLYHIAPGQRHGADGPWNRPDYYPDAVDILAPIGRHDPRAVTSYRHTQFPPEYRDGIFFGDAAGRILVCKPQRLGSSYRPRVDLFLEPRVAEGSGIQSIAVAPDGSLFAATRHAIFRMEFPAGAGSGAARRTSLEEALEAHQPQEAWSRAKWLPAAQSAGVERVRQAINDLSLPDPSRVRAIEIHVELFGPIPQPVLDAAVQTKSAAVRSRVAWALGYQASEKTGRILGRLAMDTDAMTRRAALESILRAQPDLNPESLLQLLRQNLEHPDKRLRQCAARIASRLPEVAWIRLWEPDEAHSLQRELSLLLAASWRTTRPDEEIFWRALETIPLARERWQRTQALRALQMSMGGWSTPFELAARPAPEISANALETVRAIFPTGDAVADAEASRLLALLQDEAPESVQKVGRILATFISPTAEFHYLAVLSKLRGPWPAEMPGQVAEALHNIDAKLRGPERKENWTARLKELTAALIVREPRLAEKLFIDFEPSINVPPP